MMSFREGEQLGTMRVVIVYELATHGIAGPAFLPTRFRRMGQSGVTGGGMGIESQILVSVPATKASLPVDLAASRGSTAAPCSEPAWSGRRFVDDLAPEVPFRRHANSRCRGANIGCF